MIFRKVRWCCEGTLRRAYICTECQKQRVSDYGSEETGKEYTRDMAHWKGLNNAAGEVTQQATAQDHPVELISVNVSPRDDYQIVEEEGNNGNVLHKAKTFKKRAKGFEELELKL